MQKKGTALRQAQGERGGGGGAEAKPPLPEFTPVPRRYRHDGWTPERQKAFIEALADCGSVTRAAGMVNMAQANCYALRRSPGAEEFRRAWDAALDFGLKRLKDIAFERAVEGELIPVFVAGKLMGFRRKRNDALLMFCLRHYGQDSNGKRTTINYFSSRATAGAASSDSPHPNPSPEGEGLSLAEASTTTVRTVITGDGAGGDPALVDDRSAAVLNGFEGVALDARAEAEIAAALEACAARARAADAARERGGIAALDADEDDLAEPFVRVAHGGPEYRGELVAPAMLEEFVPFTDGERRWTDAGAEVVEWVATPAPEALPAPGRKGRKKGDSGSSPE